MQMIYGLVNDFGLFLNILGAYIVFKFSLAGEQFGGYESPDTIKAKAERNKVRAKKQRVGFGLMMLGFIFQFVASSPALFLPFLS